MSFPNLFFDLKQPFVNSELLSEVQVAPLRLNQCNFERGLRTDLLWIQILKLLIHTLGSVVLVLIALLFLFFLAGWWWLSALSCWLGRRLQVSGCSVHFLF